MKVELLAGINEEDLIGVEFEGLEEFSVDEFFDVAVGWDAEVGDQLLPL